MKKALLATALLFWIGASFVLSLSSDKQNVIVVTSDAAVVQAITHRSAAELVATSTFMRPTVEPLTNEQLLVTAPEDIHALQQQLTNQLTYLNSRLLLEQEGGASLSDTEYLLKSLDRVYDRLSDTRQDILEAAAFTSPTLTDATFAGVANFGGVVGIGTSSPSEVLSVAGAVYLAETSPTTFTNRLYNTNGDLYWNGQIITGSTTANWSALSSNVFRMSGNVGIGTSTPADALTVVGTISAGTTTTRLVDTGGEVCNVEAYGAVGDNATLNDAAIAAAIAACGEGGTVYFPKGEYRIASPIVLDAPITLRGAYSPRWSYSSTPRSSIRADFGSFSGVAMVHVRDRVISGQTNHNNGGRLEFLSLDGGSAGTNVDGIYFEGLVRDWKLTDVDISQVTGNGFEAAVGDGSGNPRGFTIRGLSIYSADGHGFRATALNDSYVEDLLAVGNALRGIYLSSMGETKINNSRAVFNGLTGLYIDGSSNNGGLMFTDFSTDRNDRHGVRISLTGTTTVTFNGLLTRRDGPNTSGGSETPYAGVAVIGTTTEQVAPVFINGLSQIIGVDDAGAPPLAPLTGVRVSNASYVKVEGQLWGVDESYSDDGGNDTFIIEEGSIIKVGNDSITETPPPIYHNKWVASSTIGGLFYDGKINIGSSSDSRLLNIVAPAAAGARFRDTTNNVIFDMRAEDFQGFFGTFSNHQLRFQTNNISRLTIDIDGDVGIGTTSPDATLDVIGTIQASNLLGGATTLTTDANGNIIRNPSDQRLKTNVSTLTGALDRVLALRGVRYQWLDEERFGEQMEIGFIAQEVDLVVPEAVRKGGDYWSLNTQNLMAVVVEGLQEMWQTITGNQEKITELEERLAEVEAELGIEREEEESTLDSDDAQDEVETDTGEEDDTEVARETASTTETITANTSEEAIDTVEEDTSAETETASSTKREAVESETVAEISETTSQEKVVTKEVESEAAPKTVGEASGEDLDETTAE